MRALEAISDCVTITYWHLDLNLRKPLDIDTAYLMQIGLKGRENFILVENCSPISQWVPFQISLTPKCCAYVSQTSGSIQA